MTLDQIKETLCKGEFSSLMITCNNNGANYETIKEMLDRDAANDEKSRYYSDDDFVDIGERQRCIDTNVLWTCQWYPDTPVGFCLLHAATFDGLMKGLEKLAIESNA